MRASCASLDGAGWGQWRGRWESRVQLEGRAGVWRLFDNGREVGSWSCLGVALTDLWRRRKVRDTAPWVVGWLTYATCAGLAGGLPACRDDEGVPAGILLVEPVPGGPEPVVSPGRPVDGATFVSSLSDREFAAKVESVRREIEKGNVYQVNLCRRFSVEPWRGGLEDLFKCARGGVEPDYLYSMSWGGEQPGELVCGSMELLLRRRSDHVETRPIKGTRRRGTSAAEDLELIRDLSADPKERAELAMIVDLERNDLGKLAIPGSVIVDDPVGSILGRASTTV